MFSLTSPALPLGKLISSLALTLNPGLSFFDGAIGSFGINNFAMKAIYQNKTYQFRVSGSPSPVPAASFEFMAGSLGSDRVAAFAMLVNTGDPESFAELTSSVGTGIDFSKVAVAPSGNGASVYLILSKTDVDLEEKTEWTWSLPELEAHMKISKGELKQSQLNLATI